MIPIWKDKFVNFSLSGDSIFFRIVVGDETIYSGRAYKKPGATSVRVKVNDICADYLSTIVPNWGIERFSQVAFPLTFKVQTSTDGVSWTLIESMQFVNDWSYDYDYVIGSALSFPINGHIDSRQWIPYTVTNASSITATIHTKDGQTYTVTIPVAISDNFNTDFNTDFAKSAMSSGSGTAIFNLSGYDNVDYVVINNDVRLKVVSDCKKYALYYLNVHGGWDSLLIEGNHMMTDNVERHTRGKEYDNRMIQNASLVNYVNEIEKTVTLHTGWLNDAESQRMHNVLNATTAFLYDMETDKMLPVIITTSSTVYKTFKNNGARMVNYDIDVKVAHNLTRR